MASRSEGTVVYAAGMVQGIVLVTFPAASTIFTDRAEYDLSSTVRDPFLPQVATAITTALLAASLGRRRHEARLPRGPHASFPRWRYCRRLLLPSDQQIAYVLPAATACLGPAWPHRARPQHVCGRVPPRRRRSLDSCAQCPPRLGTVLAPPSSPSSWVWAGGAAGDVGALLVACRREPALPLGGDSCEGAGKCLALSTPVSVL